MPKPQAFTAIFPSRTNVLIAQTKIAHPFDPKKGQVFPPDNKTYNAIWDTGATSTVITEKVVRECGFQPISMTLVHHANGQSQRPMYLISIMLRNNVVVPQLKVVEGMIGNDYDVLIGMDIISLGDLAVTNRDNKTTFSFRIPSMETIDFVERVYLPQPKTGRNEICPCGSGKKYKKCHGR